VGQRLTRRRTLSGSGIGGEMGKYPQLADGQPIMIRLGDPFYCACCDCGLVHKQIYQLTKWQDEVVLVARHWRDNRRTGQKRRYMGVTYDDRRK
jgi:hypothetical protein